MSWSQLTHWGRVTHLCVSKLTIIGSDNGLTPDRRQAIIWTNAGLLLIGPLGTNFSEIFIEILIFPFQKMRLKVSSAKRRPFCLGLNVLNHVSKRAPGVRIWSRLSYLWLIIITTVWHIEAESYYPHHHPPQPVFPIHYSIAHSFWKEGASRLFKQVIWFTICELNEHTRHAFANSFPRTTILFPFSKSFKSDHFYDLGNIFWHNWKIKLPILWQ